MKNLFALCTLTTLSFALFLLFFVIREPNNFIIITSNYVGQRGLNPNTAKNKAKTIVAARWGIDFYWRGCEYDSDNQ